MKETKSLDDIFNALASGNRRQMLHILSIRPQTTSQLADRFKISLPAIHKHLGILSNAGLVLERKVGRTNFIALNPMKFGIAKQWINQYNTEWGNSQQSLSNYINTYFLTNQTPTNKTRGKVGQ